MRADVRLVGDGLPLFGGLRCALVGYRCLSDGTSALDWPQSAFRNDPQERWEANALRLKVMLQAQAQSATSAGGPSPEQYL